jgi:multisubunit Na+/H+ antiporter MnhB subunit
MRKKATERILVGIGVIILAIFANGYVAPLVTIVTGRGNYDDPFFFPVAFVFAALYGWWSRDFLLSFLVGFLSIPLIISPFPPYFLPVVFITNLLELSTYDLVDIAIFCVFGAVSGLIGVGFAAYARHKHNK